MKLRQKIFELYSENGEKFNLKNEESLLTLVVNGYTTSIDFKELFVGNIKFLKNAIKGFSILQLNKLKEGFFVDGEKNKYSVRYDEINLLFKEVSDPIFQAVDIELSESERDVYWDILVDGIKDYKKQVKDEKREKAKPEVYDVVKEENVPEDSQENVSEYVNPESLVTKDVKGKEIELEEIIEELEEQGYDHFGKGQFNVFLQHNKKPVLYIGKEKSEYISTDYLSDDKANINFIFKESNVIIGLEEDGITFPLLIEENDNTE